MSKFKVGDEVEFKNDHQIIIPKGTRFKVIDESCGSVQITMNPVINKIFIMDISEMSYQNSNRYKLKTYAKSKGKLIALSVAMGKQQAFLSSISSESRFNERGDISNTELNQLKTDVDFAERTINGIPAKAVDELKISDSSDLIKNSGHFNKCNDDLSKLKERKVIKSKTQVSRKAAGFVLFIFFIIFIFIVTGVVKGVLP